MSSEAVLCKKNALLSTKVIRECPDCFELRHNITNLGADGLQQKKSSVSTSPVSQEQEIVATIHIGSPKNLTIEDWKKLSGLTSFFSAVPFRQ